MMGVATGLRDFEVLCIVVLSLIKFCLRATVVVSLVLFNYVRLLPAWLAESELWQCRLCSIYLQFRCSNGLIY